MTPFLLSALAGVLQGARHALEPDHVTAVATVMVRAPSPRRGVFYAGCWGLGHAAMLIGVAGPLVALKVSLPDSVATALELAVGVMLVCLGVRGLREASHRHAHERSDEAGLKAARRPFAIGVMHGLAGSGALAALIALGGATATASLVCLALYAFGTILGMIGLALVASPMFARAGRLPRVAPALCRIASVASILVGVAWTVRTLVGA